MVHRHMLYLSMRYLPMCFGILSILVDYVLCLSLKSTRSGLGMPPLDRMSSSTEMQITVARLMRLRWSFGRGSWQFMFSEPVSRPDRQNPRVCLNRNPPTIRIVAWLLMACLVFHRQRMGSHAGRVPQNSGTVESRLCGVAALCTHLGSHANWN